MLFYVLHRLVKIPCFEFPEYLMFISEELPKNNSIFVAWQFYHICETLTATSSNSFISLDNTCCRIVSSDSSVNCFDIDGVRKKNIFIAEVLWWLSLEIVFPFLNPQRMA